MDAKLKEYQQTVEDKEAQHLQEVEFKRQEVRSQMVQEHEKLLKEKEEEINSQLDEKQKQYNDLDAKLKEYQQSVEDKEAPHLQEIQFKRQELRSHMVQEHQNMLKEKEEESSCQLIENQTQQKYLYAKLKE